MVKALSGGVTSTVIKKRITTDIQKPTKHDVPRQIKSSDNLNTMVMLGSSFFTLASRQIKYILHVVLLEEGFHLDPVAGYCYSSADNS